MEVRRLELTLWQGNKFYGKTFVDLTTYEGNESWKIFKDCPSDNFVVMTLSGTNTLETVGDLKDRKQDDMKLMKIIHNRYRWYRCFEDFRNVGHLTVKVFAASELELGDGKDVLNPFCVVELVNARLQTETKYKTTSPKWNKIFTFYVQDIMSILEFTVYHEDEGNRGKDVKFLGKLAIPLLQIRNGKKQWFSLKDKDLQSRAFGDTPQILVEMRLEWNYVRAISRMFDIKETKLSSEDSGKQVAKVKRNPRRLQAIATNVTEYFDYFQSIFTWESPIRTLSAYFLWTLVCLYLKMEYIPFIFILLILKNRIQQVKLTNNDFEEIETTNSSSNNNNNNDDNSKNPDDRNIEEWTDYPFGSAQERPDSPEYLIAILASYSEKIINLFNFTSPMMTFLAIALLTNASLMLQIMSIRVILLVSGTIKFVASTLQPTEAYSHAFINLLSRVPDNIEVIQLGYHLPMIVSNEKRQKTKKL